jgi:hypothetical protein
MTKNRPNKNFKIRASIAAAFLCFAAAAFFHSRPIEESFVAGAQARRTQPPRAARPTRTAAARSAGRYAEFPHSKHKQACNACHKFPSANWKTVRKGDAAFPDITEYPRHESCLSCHRRQFFRGAQPAICTICHTNPSPRDSARHPFPNPREIFDASPKGRRASVVSDFAIFFPHDKHIEIVSQDRNSPEEKTGAAFIKAGFKKRRTFAEESCRVCHQTYKPQGDADDEYFTKPPEKLGDAFWLKKGTFKTSPLGHAQCFTCHSTETGISPAPASCATCHKIKPPEPKSDFDPRVAAPMNIADKIMLQAWRKRDSSATFRHEFSSHAELECATCHNVAAMNTLDSLTKKVKVTSCAPCHITATTDDGGILNFEVDARRTNAKFQCAKCHLAFGSSAIPESHVKAITGQSGK